VVYIEIARRLAMPVRGVPLPGHFVIRYDDGLYSTFIDPFHGGSLIDAEGCRWLARTDVLNPETLRPVDRRSILMRMINNLHTCISRAANPRSVPWPCRSNSVWPMRLRD
jgi:regulator of sirC expression with transglutaminase-like and TPR domain